MSNLKKLKAGFVFILLLCNTLIFAQNKIELKCKSSTGKESAKYQLIDFNYGLARFLGDTSASLLMKQEANIGLTIKGKTDKFLLQWMADPQKDIEGVLIIKGEVEKTVVFSGTTYLSATESFRVDDDGTSNVVSLNLVVKKLSIDGIEIKLK